jgi:hypothetical protein
VADGTNQNITVNIPTMGALTVLSAKNGLVDRVTMSGINEQ